MKRQPAPRNFSVLRPEIAIVFIVALACILPVYIAVSLSVAPTKIAPAGTPADALAEQVVRTLTDNRAVQRSQPRWAMNFRHYLILKRWLDIVTAGTLLLLLAPLMLAIAVLVKLDSPGPAIFAQVRTGS